MTLVEHFDATISLPDSSAFGLSHSKLDIESRFQVLALVVDASVPSDLLTISLIFRLATVGIPPWLLAVGLWFLPLPAVQILSPKLVVPWTFASLESRRWNQPSVEDGQPAFSSVVLDSRKSPPILGEVGGDCERVSLTP